MTSSFPARPNARPPAVRASEQGYALLFAVFLLALLVLSLSVAAPIVAKSIERDREVETFHRGMQYRRAIQLYYRKFTAYPPNVDALVNTNNIRFLRKKYIDPMTGKDDWKPVMFGQNKTPTAMGFFGQPLAGNASTVAGIGPSGGVTGLPGITPLGGFSNNPSGGSSSYSNNGQPPSAITSGSDSNPGSSSGTDSGASNNTTDSSGSSGGGSSPSGGSSSPGSGSGIGSSTGQNGQTFGGAGIIGFSPALDKKSILIYKKKQKYNEWEFTYDPISDQKMIAGGNAGIGQPIGSQNTNNPFATPPSTPTPSPAPTPAPPSQ